MCGRWESFPREFAKCRRCRKAKYCGKECQSIAWSEGHRFWCSAKDNDDDADREGQGDSSRTAGATATSSSAAARAERRAAREQERAARLEARVVEEFGPRTGRTVNNPDAPPNTATPAPAAATEAPRQRQGAFGGNWSFSPLTLRRPRPRADDGAANPNEPQVPIRFRGNTAALSVNEPVDISFHYTNVQGRTVIDSIEVGGTPTNGRPAQDGGAGSDGDEPMVIG